MTAARAERSRRLPLWVIGWLFATLSLWLFLRAFDLKAAWRVMAQAKLGWITLALAANFAVLPLLTEQWSRLLPKARAVRWKTLWECVTLALAAMNTLPFGGGHAVGVGLIARRAGVGWPAAVSLVALEQLCDAFAKVALLLTALAVAPLSPVLRSAAWVLGGALLAGFCGLLWLAHHPVDAPVSGWRAKWGQHLEVLKRPGIFVGAVSLSLAIKLCGLAAVYAVQRSLGVELPLGSTALVLAAVTFATLVSMTPSDLGIYEAAVFGAYRLLGIPAGEAAALGLVQHACFLLPVVGTGYALTFWRMMKGPDPARAESTVKVKRVDVRAHTSRSERPECAPK